MKFFPSIVVIVFLTTVTLACRQTQIIDGQYEKISTTDTIDIKYVDDGGSFYDTISAPILGTDTNSLYLRIPRLMKFTNLIKWSNGRDFYYGLYEITTSGEWLCFTSMVSPTLKKDIPAVVDSIIHSLPILQPAYSKKRKLPVSYDVTISIVLDRDSINLNFFGPENRSLLKRSFERPI